jgi:hypothetical protein
MDEGRKRVIMIAAAILGARKLEAVSAAGGPQKPNLSSLTFDEKQSAVEAARRLRSRMIRNGWISPRADRAGPS